MKTRTILFAAVLIAIALLPTGCKKEGIYKPDEKLAGFSQYYERVHQRYDSDSHLWRTIQKDSTKRSDTEKWVWDGNLLHHIDIYTQGTLVSTVSFEYDGKRLARTKISGSKVYMDYEYNGRQLNTITCKNQKGETIYTDKFEYDGNKISKIISTSVSSAGIKSSINEKTFALLPVLGDVTVAHNVAETSCKKNNLKASEQVLEITWKGNNIKSVTEKTSGAKTTYRHDDKTNPLQGLLATMTGIGDVQNTYAFGNKNNITNVDDGIEKESFSYTYSSDLPTSCSRSVVDHYTQGYRYVTTYITYYEYLEN
ncbi:MAG: hypothetical protein J6031_08275 [Bacteroidales bacterium]|nr:hypothetical protein [Bacteroidales bacterium]